MIEALKEIGEAAISGGYGFPIKKLKGKGTLLAKIIFDLDAGRLDCDCIKCDQEIARDYLWVGNAVGQKTQMVLTTDDPKYLLDPTKSKKWSIGQIIYKIDKMDLKDEDVRKLQGLLSEIKVKFFLDGNSRLKELDSILSERSLSYNDIILYTTCIRKDGKTVDLVKEPGYRKFLPYVLYETESEEYPLMKSVCHVCGEEKEVLTNPSYPEGSILCMYNVDKSGFFPGLSRDPNNMLKAHVVCVDCKQKLMSGLNFVEMSLTATIGDTSAGRLSVFLIPKIVGGKIDNLLEKIPEMKEAFNAAKTYENLSKIETLMEEFADYSEPMTYSLNLLFGYRRSSHFNFQYLIQNVPVTRLIEIAGIASRISNQIAEFFSEDSRRWSIGFDDICSIFPLRAEGGRIEDWKPIVELFNAMLSGTSYPKEVLISKAALYSRILRYETYGGYSIRPVKKSDEGLCRGILKYNLLLKVLGELGVVEMDSPRAAGPEIKIPDEKIEAFLSEMGYTEWQKSLFLLGLLVGRIGVEQHKRGDEKKAVLNKINFQGMHAESVKLLANYVLDGLRNYRILNEFNEAIYAVMKVLLDRNIGSLQNPADNVFYILSGYAYATLQAITGGR